MVGVIVDLSMPFGNATPAYPGDLSVELTQIATLDADGFVGHRINCDSHNGTHIDAPLHMIEGGKGLDAFPIERFVGRGRLVDLALPDMSDFRAGDIVLLHSGFSEAADAPGYFDKVPAITTELVVALVEAGVSMVGVDAGSVDADPFPVHKTFLGNDILIIENLVNLEKLRGRPFDVCALPLNVAIDGSPAREIATNVA